MKSTALTVVLWVSAIGAAISFGRAAPQEPAVGKSVSDGVYSAAQAERGEEVFKARCTTCHDNARFTGDGFLENWTGKPLHALFDVLKTTMPEDTPGALKPQEYADVIAFFLKLNGFPPGPDELKATEAAMKAIKLERKGG